MRKITEALKRAMESVKNFIKKIFSSGSTILETTKKVITATYEICKVVFAALLTAALAAGIIILVVNYFPVLLQVGVILLIFAVSAYLFTQVAKTLKTSIN